MRIPTIAGLLLIAVGLFVLWKRPTYATHQDVIRFGEFKASVDQRKEFPAGWGAAGVIAGTALVLLAKRRRGG